MYQTTKRGFALLLAFVLCLSLLAGVRLPQAQAASYVANWGVRGEEATELSSYAVNFYGTAGVSYSGLSGLSGSSTLDQVPDSALFKQLQLIMQTYHTYETDYEETKDLYKYTDCQERDTGYITCIWCGQQYDGAWPYGGDPWNREHTWPKSKSLDGNDQDVDQVDEEDIMLLRPACMGENSSHGNKAYGSTTNETYFYPNIDKGYGNDARGDIARTMLYVYVRYGNSAYMWGSSGVIQSKELLLQWMEEDPVDTWEMGRNDSVQSITGTRNIFIDYPELAFKLFNESVPANYPTPSGGVDSGTGAAVTVSFRENGTLTTNVSANEGAAFTFPAAKNTAPSGYSFVGWVAGTVAETTSRPTTIYTPGGSALAASRTYHALYSKVDPTQAGSDYVLHTGTVTEGDYLFIAADGAMSTAANGSADRRDAIPVTVTDNTVYSPDAALIWHIAPTNDGYYTFYNAAMKQYAAANGTSNKLVMSGTLNDYAKWSISGEVITNKGNQAKGVNHTLRRNGNYGFACYAASTGTAPVLYKAAAGAVTYTTTIQGAACQHTTTYISGKINATCTSAGYSGDTVCLTCGETLSTGSAVAQLEHSYVNGTCSGCGMAEPLEPVYTLVTPENITAGNYVIGAVRSGAYPTVYLATSSLSTGNNNDWYVTETSVTATNNAITSLPNGTQILTLSGDNTNGFTIGFAANGVMQYLGYTNSSSSRKLALGSGYSNYKWKVVADSDGGIAFVSTTSKYTISQNSTTTSAIRGYYNGTIYTGLYLFKQTIPQAEKPKVAQVGDTQYESFADAYAAANGQPIQLLANLGSSSEYYDLELTRDVTIDLNGFFAYVSATGNYSIYGMDSATTDYATEDYGSLYVTGVGVKAADGYLALADGSGNSFHAYKLDITHISLDPAHDALGFKAQLFGDYRVQDAVSGFGFNISTPNGKPIACTKTGTPADGIFTLRLKGILAAGGGETQITASAFVTLNAQHLQTQNETTSMKQTMQAVNGIWSSLSAVQQTAAQQLYSQYAAVIAPWLEGTTNNFA